MSVVNGIVDNVSTKYEKYSVQVNGTWYSTKMEWATCKPNKGDKVEFDDAGGKFTKNMRIISAGAGGISPTFSGSTSSAPVKASYSRGSFPIALEDGQRSIIRQNALTNARELVGLTIDVSTGFEEEATVKLIIAVAREFEAYTAGDIERYAAEEALKDFSVS